MQRLSIPLFTLLLGISTSGFSQSLDVFIDVTGNKVTFVSGLDTIKQPVVKRGEPITIHLQNYNNYLYDVKIEEAQQQLVFQSSGIDTSQVLSMAGSGRSSEGGSSLDFFSILGGTSGMLGLDMLAMEQLPMIGGLTFTGKGFAMDEQEKAIGTALKEIRQKFETELTNIQGIESTMSSISTEIETILDSKAKQDVAIKELQKIRYNPRLSPEKIQSLSKEYMNMIFETEDLNKLDAQKLWEKSQVKDQIKDYLDLAETQKSQYQESMQNIQTLTGSFYLFDPLNIRSEGLKTNFETLFKSVSETYAKGQKNMANMDSTLVEAKKTLKTYEGGDFERLSELRYLQEELLNNNFTYTYTTTAQKDLVELGVTLKPKPDLPAGVTASERRVAGVQVQAKGGLKINASVGLSFGQFFEAPKSYFVRDSTILSQNEDSFVPVLTSFLHFYPHTPKQVAVGGSFGIGLPVFNNNGGQSISFFLGPSLFLGGAQRAVLTGGIMGGRVSVLSNGYEEGDVLEPFLFEVPVSMKYRLGYFLGLSINIVGQ